MNLFVTAIMKETLSNLLSTQVITRRCFQSRRDRQEQRERTDQKGRFFCCIMTIFALNLAPFLVTLRGFVKRRFLIEPAIQHNSFRLATNSQKGWIC